MKRIALILIVLGLIGSSVRLAQTQSNAQLPAIVSFTINPATPLALSQVETGQTSAELTWYAVGMTENFRLVLQTYRLNVWESLLSANEPPLAATGGRTIQIEHPLNFGPPMYRLSILDGQGNSMDERIVSIAYDTTPTIPQITQFTADVTGLSEDQLAQGSAQITVSWEVANRPPASNLMFEQFRADGTAFSIELPRSFVWVPSVGTGAVAPRSPENEDLLRLRVRLVDVISGLTLHERNLTIPIGEAAVNVPTIHQFTAEPAEIERGGEVTVTWSVTGAEVISVGQIDVDGSYIRSDETFPANGSTTFTALEGDYYTANFFIYAGDAQGNGITSTTSVAVNCPYIYFFTGVIDVEGTCPLSEAEVITAAHQLFERGEMIWRSDRIEIIALYSDGTYERFADTFQEGETIEFDEEPPGELLAPIRGFGKVWINNENARQQLGWALGAEIAYAPIVQAVADGTLGNEYADDFLTLPNAELVVLHPNGTWELLPDVEIVPPTSD